MLAIMAGFRMSVANPKPGAHAGSTYAQMLRLPGLTAGMAASSGGSLSAG
jgi:hypothetical protein